MPDNEEVTVSITAHELSIAIVTVVFPDLKQNRG